jgi:hypothetical protein
MALKKVGILKVYDKEYNIIAYIKDDKLYDRNWNIKGYIEGDKVYDRKYNLKYITEEQ